MLTAIIPARGGSKGVTRKNMQRIHGETLIAIAIRKCANVADRVIVSSDDSEIIVEAVGCGAEIVRRPADLSSDTTPSVDVLRHAVKQKQITGSILWVQCTAPLVTEDDLRRCVHERGNADLAILCNRFHGYVMNDSGDCINRDIVRSGRRQDQSGQQWLVSGSAWAFDVSYLRQAFYTGTVQPVEQFGAWCDIDEPKDMETARKLAPQSSVNWMMS